MKRSLLFGVGMLATLGVPTAQVLTAQRHLAAGEEIALELLPRDPRSLLQGDFMRLRWSIEAQLSEMSVPDTPHAVVRVAPNGVAAFVRFDLGEPLADDERHLDFTLRDDHVDIAPDAWFFEEGTAERYEPARYGVLAITPAGEVMLVGLLDDELSRLDTPD